MDRTLLLQQLAEVEHHIARGEMHLAQQHDLIAEMDRNREDSTLARDILDTFIGTQALHWQDRARLLKALKGSVP